MVKNKIESGLPFFNLFLPPLTEKQITKRFKQNCKTINHFVIFKCNVNILFELLIKNYVDCKNEIRPKDFLPERERQDERHINLVDQKTYSTKITQ